jgi:hypothetical protein
LNIEHWQVLKALSVFNVQFAAAAVTTDPAGGLPQPSGPFSLPVTQHGSQSCQKSVATGVQSLNPVCL